MRGPLTGCGQRRRLLSRATGAGISVNLTLRVWQALGLGAGRRYSKSGTQGGYIARSALQDLESILAECRRDDIYTTGPYASTPTHTTYQSYMTAFGQTYGAHGLGGSEHHCGRRQQLRRLLHTTCMHWQDSAGRPPQPTRRAMRPNRPARKRKRV